MAFNPFIGRSQEWLESELEKAQEDYAAGKTTSSINAGDAGSSKVVQLTPEQRIRLLLKALNLLDSTLYPDSSIRRVTRTQVQVYGNVNESYGD